MTRRSEDLAPCGTEAASRRHYRRGEKPCEDCRLAANRASAERNGGSDPYAELAQPPQAAARNGLPIVPYQYRARTYDWAAQAIRRAEAVCGRLEPETDCEAA